MNTSKFVAPNTVFDSSVSFLRNVTFDSSVYLQGTAHITLAAEDAIQSDTPYALVVGTIGTDVSIQYKQLGTMAFETSTNYYSKPEVDVLIADVSTQLDTRLDFIDTSILGLNNLTQQHTTDIADVSARVNTATTGLAEVSARVFTAETDITNLETSVGVLNNWNVNQDTSILTLNNLIQNLDSSLDLYVAKSGDTMTGPLTISQGGLVVAGDVSITTNGDLYVDGDTTIKGNLTINGSLYVVDVESIDVSSAYIHLNTGLTGAPPTSLQSGIVVGRGDAEPYVFLFDESNQTFRIGIAAQTSTGYLDASTQAVATREDAPLANGIAYWNDTLNRFDTSTGFTAASVINHFAALDASVVQNRTDIADVSARLANFSPLDLSARIFDTETSIGALDIYTQALDGSIDFLFAWDAAKDASIIRIDASLNDVVDITTIIDGSLNQLYTDIADVSARVNVNTIGISDVSARVNTNTTDIGYLETSVGALDLLTQRHTTDIADVSTRVFAAETSIGVLTDWILDVSADKLSAVANVAVDGSGAIFAYEQDSVAYLKKIIAGAGIVITEDASRITIAGDTASGVYKYTSTFDGTANSSIGISAVTHGLGVGPLTVTVYEGTQQIWADVDCDAAGNIVINWAPGSLGASCKYVIMG